MFLSLIVRGRISSPLISIFRIKEILSYCHMQTICIFFQLSETPNNCKEALLHIFSCFKAVPFSESILLGTLELNWGNNLPFEARSNSSRHS